MTAEIFNDLPEQLSWVSDLISISNFDDKGTFGIVIGKDYIKVDMGDKNRSCKQEKLTLTSTRKRIPYKSHGWPFTIKLSLSKDNPIISSLKLSLSLSLSVFYIFLYPNVSSCDLSLSVFLLFLQITFSCLLYFGNSFNLFHSLFTFIPSSFFFFPFFLKSFIYLDLYKTSILSFSVLFST